MLGICVVYLAANAEGHALIDLSVRQIRRLTHGPFRLYGCCPDNDGETLRRMHANGVIVVDNQARRPHISDEHASLLDILVDRACLDGCTHVATLDMDSWPICDGWDIKYGELLDDRIPLAAIVRTELGDNFPFAAFVLMRQEFWRVGASSFSTRLRANFGPEATEISSRPSETGSGILAQLFSDSRSFFRLERTNRWNIHHLIAGIYDNTIFHLGAGSRMPQFISDDWTYGLNGSELRRQFADCINAASQAFAVAQVLQRHDQFISELASGNLDPLLPIQSDPAVLPKQMTPAPVKSRRSWQP